MLIIKAFVNERLIDEVWIHNKGPLQEEGKYEYVVVNPKGSSERISYQRDKGWIPLTIQALNMILMGRERKKEQNQDYPSQTS